MVKGLIICLFLVSIFLYSLILNINKPLSLLHGDAFLVNFILKHWMKVFSRGEWNTLFTLPMFYGFENSLFFTDHHLIHALMALPIYIITQNIILTSNLLIFSTILFSFLSMYLLAHYFTKNTAASLLAAIIFIFNPFIFARFPDQLILLSLQWIPLIFLYLEKSLKNPSNKNLFLFFLFLTCQLLSSLYYSVFLTVILPIYALVRFWQEKIPLPKLLNRGAVLGLVVFLGVAIISGYFYYQTFSKYPIERGLEKTAIYSALPSDYLFTSHFNILYGGLKDKAAQLWPSVVRVGIYSEQNLFWGIVPIVLFIAGFRILKSSAYRKIWLLSLFLLSLSFLLSLGPKIYISQNLTIPGPYQLVYLIDPLFGFLRTAARFGIFVYFFLALIAAFCWDVLLKKMIPVRLATLFSVLLISLLIIEYWNMPWEFTNIDKETKGFYNVLNSQNQIKVILDYPIGNLIPYIYSQARAEDLDAHYLLWATILHNKILFNGYTGFLPQQYYDRANLLSIGFPTTNKLNQLKKWGVDAIVLHKDEFNKVEDFAEIKTGLILLKVSVLAETNNLALFDLTKWSETP